MQLNKIRDLTFALVLAPRLVYEATNWQKQSGDGLPDAKQPRRSGTSHSDRRYSDKEYDCVDLIIKILNSLDDESLELKLNELEKLPENQTAFSKRNLPLNLSQVCIDECARNNNWPRYVIAMQSLGFVVNERCKDQLHSTVYDRLNYGTFTDKIALFPLLEAFMERDKILINSGLFKANHISYYSDQISAVDALNWLMKVKVEMPSGMIETVKGFHGENKSPLNKPFREDDAAKPNPNPKERTSMLSLIHAMALSKFQYEEGKSLGPAKNKIHQAILDAGLSMSERTIGDYLQAAQKEADRQRDKKQ